MLKNFLAWMSVAKGVWIPLLIGWLTPVLALLPDISLAQSGALMVCAGVVAEILDPRRYDLALPWDGNHLDSWYKCEITEAGVNETKVELDSTQIHLNSKKYQTNEWPLYRIAKDSELHDEDGRTYWHLAATAARLRKTLKASIVTTVVFGTLLWAFA